MKNYLSILAMFLCFGMYSQQIITIDVNPGTSTCAGKAGAYSLPVDYTTTYPNGTDIYVYISDTNGVINPPLYNLTPTQGTNVVGANGANDGTTICTAYVTVPLNIIKSTKYQVQVWAKVSTGVFAANGNTVLLGNLTVPPTLTIATPNLCLNNTPITLAGKPSGGTYSGTGMSGAVFSPTVAGVGTAKIKYTYNTGYCGTYSVVANVLVNALPSAPIITQSTDTLISTSAVDYDWYWNGNTLTNDTLQRCPATQNGNYYVEITDANGCKNRSADYNVIAASVQNINLEKEASLLLYPNPVIDKAILNITPIKETDILISLINVSGQVLKTELMKNVIGETVKEISITEHTGIYFLKIEQLNLNKTIIKKLIVQ